MGSAMVAAPPAPPKKAMNGYMFFANDRRPKLKKEKPDLPITEVAKLMGAEWKEMDAKKQKPYVTKADKDKKRYEKELATYTKQYGEPPKRKVKKNKPKRTRKPQAFNMFVKEQMPKMKG